jgi:serine/threonine protein kinase
LARDTLYLKLCDFGLSIDDSMCWSIWGTYEYLALEVLFRKSHGPEVDWWALAILCSRLFFKGTPFCAPDPEFMRDKILNKTLCVPDCGSPDSIEKNPEKRFGFNEFVSHHLFDDISFDTLTELKINPPFKPKRFGPREIPPTAQLRGSRSCGSFGTGDGAIRGE